MKRVLTFGVYDMLHIGHMLLFQRAKALGDHLIVAVQDGEFIQKYKPGTEMVYTTDERLYMVGWVPAGDAVVPGQRQGGRGDPAYGGDFLDDAAKLFENEIGLHARKDLFSGFVGGTESVLQQIV